MKKILGITLGLLLSGVAISQNNDQIQNKKGIDIMPVKGEYAIGLGFNALGYLGNMFSGTANNTYGNSLLRNSGLGGASIFGKYMLTDNKALRASFNNNGYDNTDKVNVYNDNSNDPDSTVIDVRRRNYSYTQIGVGYEFRRGKTRLRGIYGGDFLISYTGGQDWSYTYGNPIHKANMAPTTATFNGANWTNDAMRPTKINRSGTIGLGLRGFVGVEYYIAPKICIGTELGWTARWSDNSITKTTNEYFDINADSGAGKVITKDIITESGRSINSGIDNANGQIYFTFYF